MSSVNWSALRRVLVAWEGRDHPVDGLVPALQAVQYALPEAQLVLLVQTMPLQAERLQAVYASLVDDILTSPAPWYTAEALGQTIGWIGRGGFEAALIFVGVGQSPYPLAYMCYLAGVPIRVGWSLEFGGGLLAMWLKPPAAVRTTDDQYLTFIRAVGLLPCA